MKDTENADSSSETEEKTPERRQSFDQVRKLVQQEGKEARNLVSFQIPADQPLNIDTSVGLENRKNSTNVRHSSKFASSSPRGLVRTTAHDASVPYRLKLRHHADADFRALHWTHLFETLKRTVGAIYDICHVDQSVIECKEAIMILENYTKDFVTLIDFWNREAEWNRSERPTSIAWEVRKTVGSPNKPFMNSDYNERVSAKLKCNLFQDDLNFDSGLETPPDISTPDGNVSPIILAVEKTGLSDDIVPKHDDQLLGSSAADDGWKVVTYAKHRRNSKDSTNGSSHSVVDDDSSKVGQPSQPNLLTSRVVVPQQRQRIFPKSAQDIRQTKASLAKMEFNRQYLAEQRRKEVDENLKLTKFCVVSGGQKIRRFNTVNGSYSLPSLNHIGINFADPAAVKRIAQAAKANWRTWKSAGCGGGGRKGRFRSYQSAESLCSLESIREEDNAETFVECSSLKPTELGQPVVVEKTELGQLLVNSSATVVSSSSSSNQKVQQNVEQQQEDKLVTKNFFEIENIEEQSALVEISTETPVFDILDNRHSIATLEVVEFGDDDDEAWQHLTEEEESLAQEEESLQKEIEEERKSIDIEVNNRCAAALEDDEDDDTLSKKNNVGSLQNLSEIKDVPVDGTPMTWEEVVERWNADCPTKFSWAEMVEYELGEVEVRSPGQAVQVHEKLSSPSRKRTNVDDTLRKHEERLAKAEELRQRLLDEQQKRLNKLTNRVEEVRAKRNCVLERKRKLMENRLEKAAENRSSQLQMKVKKAHDEEEKVHEIAFINSLEADNKRHDVLSRQQDHEMRLQCIHEERLRKLEEKAAREQAVEERRKAAEEERQTRAREMAERTKRRQEQVEKDRTNKEQVRQQLAKEKAREREERLAERQAARLQTKEDLLQRIQQKQEESIRRHEENLELKKQRASEMSTPRLLAPLLIAPNLPNQISNEVILYAHIKGDRHVTTVKEIIGSGKAVSKETLEIEMVKCIVDASDDKVQSLNSSLNENDKIKTCNKRRQKLRQKILAKLIKADKEIEKCFALCGLEKQWLPPEIHSLERALNEINRTLSSNGAKDQESFFVLKNREILLKLLSLVEKSNNGIDSLILPSKCLINICSVLKVCCRQNSNLCLNVLYNGHLLSYVDVLAYQLKYLNANKKTSDNRTKESSDESFCICLLSLINEHLSVLTNKSTRDKTLLDVYPGSLDGFQISYIVCSRYVENIGSYIKATSIDNELNTTKINFVIESIDFLKLLLKLLHNSCKKLKENSTPFLDTLKINELCYVVSFLYSTLLNPTNVVGDQQNSNFTNIQLCDGRLRLICTVLDLINFLGVVDLKCLQESLGQEGTSLEFRHIASFLMSYSNRFDCPDVLHRIIVAIGFFTSCNSMHQDLVHSGSQPSILQQLCVLPFAYFSDSRLTKILFPTLIACCYRNEPNRRLLEEELSGKLLSSFIEENLEMEETVDSKKSIMDDCDKMIISLDLRFPFEELEQARDYFAADILTA